MRAIRAKNAIDTVEASYSLEGTDGEWLTGILHAAAADIDLGSGTYALTCTIADRQRIEPGTAFVTNELSPAFIGVVGELNATAPAELVRSMLARHVSCGTMTSAFGADHPGTIHFKRTVARAGFRDGFSLFAQDGEDRGVVVSAPTKGSVEVPPRAIGIWKKIGVHIAAGARLRRRLAAQSAERDALLDPNGSLKDANGRVAESATARERLAAAVHAIDRARSRAGRREPEDALRLWRGLVDGEWSLVDHWESDGRRYIAAFQNRPDVRDPRALSAQERVVLSYASLGASNKEIAFSLGVSESSVGDAVSRVLRKLGCRRRSDLAALADPEALQRFHVGDDDAAVDVLTLDVTPNHERLSGLTSAEREVALHALAGASDEAIATARGTSVHTVAKQLRAIYGKLGVESRTEMVRRLTRTDQG